MDAFLDTLDTFQKLFRIKKRDNRKIRKADLDALARLGKEQWFFVLNRDIRCLPELLGLLHLDGNVNKDDKTFWVYVQALIAQAEFACFAAPVVQHVDSTVGRKKESSSSAVASSSSAVASSLEEGDDVNPFGNLITEIARDVELKLQNPLEIQNLMGDMQGLLSGQAPSAQLSGLIDGVRAKISQKVQLGELDVETLKAQSLHMLSSMSLGDLAEKKM